MFPATSRYRDIGTAKYQRRNGEEVVYLRRRFLPPISEGRPEREHVVAQGERLDNVTARYLDNPELFWRLADVNGAMHPAELTAEIGRRLRIPLFQEG